MQKERLEGLTLQISAVFNRLDALKQSLPKEGLEKYNLLIEQKKQHYRENYDVNAEQLEEWMK